MFLSHTSNLAFPKSGTCIQAIDFQDVQHRALSLLTSGKVKGSMTLRLISDTLASLPLGCGTENPGHSVNPLTSEETGRTSA